MTFASIPRGSQLFLDANTVYYFTAEMRRARTLSTGATQRR